MQQEGQLNHDNLQELKKSDEKHSLLAKKNARQEQWNKWKID